MKHEWKRIKEQAHTILTRLRMGEYDTPIVLSLGVLITYIVISTILIITKG